MLLNSSMHYVGGRRKQHSEDRGASSDNTIWGEKNKDHTALRSPRSDYNRTELGMCFSMDICTLCNSHEAMSIKMTITPSTECLCSERSNNICCLLANSTTPRRPLVHLYKLRVNFCKNLQRGACGSLKNKKEYNVHEVHLCATSSSIW